MSLKGALVNESKSNNLFCYGRSCSGGQTGFSLSTCLVETAFGNGPSAADHLDQIQSTATAGRSLVPLDAICVPVHTTTPSILVKAGDGHRR